MPGLQSSLEDQEETKSLKGGWNAARRGAFPFCTTAPEKRFGNAVERLPARVAQSNRRQHSAFLLDKCPQRLRHSLEMTGPGDLERWYDEHAQALFAFLLSLTRNETDTRDLLQEIFTRLAQRPALLQSARDERAFLLHLAHNLVIDHARRRGTREKNHDRWTAETPSWFAAGPNADEPTFRLALAAALAELPDEQRAVVHLKLWEELTFEAIAQTLEIPPNTAASRFRYGIDKLRERLRPLYDELKAAE
jgi:RNA polymerase sigma-70 factor, ECF subfamily